LDGEDTVGGGGLKLSRKDRRQAKKAAQEAAAAAAESATTGYRPSPEGSTAKEREFKALTAQLQPLSLKIHPIPADGNCLYRAVADQLLTLATAATASPPPSTPDHRTLRTRAADFIRVYWEDFAPFLPYEEGDAYPAAEAAGEVRSAVARYCDRMATSASWGGHPEIRALANVLGCPIVVYREGSPPLEFNPKGEERALGVGGGGSTSRRQLCITFHAHALASGEHYNSARVVV
jgi:OTU domain-containing protein 6